MRFPSFSTGDTLGQTLCSGGLSWTCSSFSSIPGPHQQCAGAPSSCDNQKCLQTLPQIGGWENIALHRGPLLHRVKHTEPAGSCVGTRLSLQSEMAVSNLFHLTACIDQLLKFWGTRKNVFFANLTNKGIIFIHLHLQTLLCWLLSFVLFDNVKEKRSVPLTKQAGIACFKNPCSTLVKDRWSKRYLFHQLKKTDSKKDAHGTILHEIKKKQLMGKMSSC